MPNKRESSVSSIIKEIQFLEDKPTYTITPSLKKSKASNGKYYVVFDIHQWGYVWLGAGTIFEEDITVDLLEAMLASKNTDLKAMALKLLTRQSFQGAHRLPEGGHIGGDVVVP